MRTALYVRTGKFFSVFVALSNEHTGRDIDQVDNITCREHDVTTLPLISISRQHRTYVRDAHLRRTAVYAVVVFIGFCGP